MRLENLHDELMPLRAESTAHVPRFRAVGLDGKVLITGYAGRLISYRGYYDQLALPWDAPGTITVAELLADVLAVLGGDGRPSYKSGTFYYTERTAVWAANWGDVTDWGYSHAEQVNEREVHLHTVNVGDYQGW